VKNKEALISIAHGAHRAHGLNGFYTDWVCELWACLRVLCVFSFTTKGNHTSPCFGVARTSLSLWKERDVAQRQGEVKQAGNPFNKIAHRTHGLSLWTLSLPSCSLWFLFNSNK